MEELENKIADLKEKIDDLKEKISDLEDDINEKDNEIENLEYSITELKEELEDIEENGIQSKLEEIFSMYNTVWADSTRDIKLLEVIKDLKGDLHY